MKCPIVIAEIGATHLGSLDRAKELVSLAKLCGANYAKFQKRDPELCVPLELRDKPHPNQKFAYGNTYLEHRKALELSIEQHKEIMEYCSLIGIKYASSVWDINSTKDIISLDTDFIKIPSACNHNKNLITYIFDNSQSDIHISLGMSSFEEKESLIKYLKSYKSQRFVIYHCTSLYPCPFDKLHLLEIERLQEYGLRVGFSNHGYGIAADIASMVLGAEYIERHFIDDRSINHTDAAASLEPEGLRKLCRDLKNVSSAMSYAPYVPDEIEMKERRKLRID